MGKRGIRKIKFVESNGRAIGCSMGRATGYRHFPHGETIAGSPMKEVWDSCAK